MSKACAFLRQVAISSIALLGFAAQDAAAQSTDGYHSYQVIPVVVDSTSFAQRFEFRRPTEAGISTEPVTVAAIFFPAQGTVQTRTACPSFVIGSSGVRSFGSLRELCPGIGPGSTFGFVFAYETDAQTHPFAVFSRVSNTAGIGFSVEGFPAYAFGSGISVVTGLRRSGASVSAPAFQSNCFIANLNRLNAPEDSTASAISYQLLDANNAVVGSGLVNLAPGGMVRLLDVFAAGDANAGDYEGVRFRVAWNGVGQVPALMSFCTVQDNSSFGADFRIGKQEWNLPVEDAGSVGPGGDGQLRDSTSQGEVFPGWIGWARPFLIPAGQISNQHTIFFHHPDSVQCELINPATGLRFAPNNGISLWMRTAKPGPLYWSFPIIAGGNGITGFGEIYLGDKSEQNQGRETRYWLDVDIVNPVAQDTPYYLHCRSGSGHSSPITDQRGTNP